MPVIHSYVRLAQYNASDVHLTPTALVEMSSGIA